MYLFKEIHLWKLFLLFLDGAVWYWGANSGFVSKKKIFNGLITTYEYSSSSDIMKWDLNYLKVNKKNLLNLWLISNCTLKSINKIQSLVKNVFMF